jgi:hypothetical protein
MSNDPNSSAPTPVAPRDGADAVPEPPEIRDVGRFVVRRVPSPDPAFNTLELARPFCFSA